MSNNKKGDPKQYWRSLAELENSASEVTERQPEFPEGTFDPPNRVTRRNFLTMMSASLALAGVGCFRKPLEKIVPYVIQPEEVIPGVAQHYATTMPFGLDAFGLVVESHEGRPTKIEGNKNHSSSLGGTNPLIQASILGLYDPDRSKITLNHGSDSSWDDFVTFWRKAHLHFAETKGAGLAVLSEAFSSPTMARLKAEFLSQFPQAVWVTYEPVSDENIYEGVRIASGKPLRPVYSYGKADVIVSLDSDFLFGESDNVAAARGFADGRRITSEHDTMNRLYVAEGVFSLTGTMADHRLRVESSQIAPLAAALAAELSRRGLQIPIAGRLGSYSDTSFDKKWLAAAASDLIAAKGKGVVVAGRRQPPIVHALALAINQALGNVGATVSYREITDCEVPSRAALGDLTKKMLNSQVDTVVIIGGNPVYDAPADLDFVNALAQVPNRIGLGMYLDETADTMIWHLPQAHYLESWGDARSADGTASVIQPLILPLFGGHSSVELLGLLASGIEGRGYDIVRQTWNKFLTGSFERNWEGVLFEGRLAYSALPLVTPAVDDSAMAQLINQGGLKASAQSTGTFEVVFAQSAMLYDGRFANNGWLQEAPHPVTKITWDNVALISPAAARELNVDNGDIVKITVDGNSIKIPAWIQPGQAERTVTLDLGYGRRLSGRVGKNIGVDVYPIRTTSSSDFVSGVAITPNGRTCKISTTQDHDVMEGRPLVREATLAEYRQKPTFAQNVVEHPPLQSLWTEYDYSKGNQWGMTVDLTTCIGCAACALACQSENNTVVVGKKQVGKGRRMHWIRVDRYYQGTSDDPEVVHQVVACQHCENAPCEQVCPVAATLHDSEGLNLQVYNRCIGTRYCSNNCPYKVRRFNFFNYTKDTPEIVRMAMNPDVTVRSRGVMEKCTFCLHRINRAKIKAKLDGRELHDGEVVTACQQACPTGAIVFGNIVDANSRVSQTKKQNRNYALLDELNTKPRLSYLARIRNPNPNLG